MNLNDEELEIKYIVAAKFDEANGRKVKTQLENLFFQENKKIHGYETNSKTPKTPEKCKKCSLKDNSVQKNQIPEQIHSLRNIKLQKGPQISIRNDLSLRKTETLEINPQHPPTRINTGTFQLRHETPKVDWIDAPTSLIDTGVQTSLRDSSQHSKFEDALSRSGCCDLDQNKIDESRGVEAGKIDDEGPEDMKKRKKQSFMDFLCGIRAPEDKISEKSIEKPQKSLEKPQKNNSISLKNSLTSLNSSIMSLKTPKTEDFDELLSKIDKKLEFISLKTEKFDDICKINCEKITNEEENVQMDELITKKSEYALEVLLPPRSRVSSSSSAVSETLLPARYSTPLDNWKIQSESSVKLRSDARTIISASAPILSHGKNNFIEGIVPMTSEYEDKRDESEENSKTSLFPTYSSDKSSQRSEIKSLRSEESIKMGIVEDKITKETLQEFPGDLRQEVVVADNQKNSENFFAISGDGNQDKNMHFSSGRDGTSHDISKLSSGVLEEFCDDREKLDDQKSQNSELNLQSQNSISNQQTQTSKSTYNSQNSTSNDKNQNSLSFEESKREKEISKGCEEYKNEDFIGKASEIISNSGEIPEEKSSEKTLSDRKSIPSSSSSLSSNKTTQKNSNGDYSEGELFLPSSCAYSLGEVISGRGIINKICINLSRESSKIQPPDHSPGELLDTDIDSNSSE